MQFAARERDPQKTVVLDDMGILQAGDPFAELLPDALESRRSFRRGDIELRHAVKVDAVFTDGKMQLP